MNKAKKRDYKNSMVKKNNCHLMMLSK